MSRGFAILVSILLACGGLLVPSDERQLAAASSASTTAALNLRASPSTGAGVLRVIPAGAAVAISGASNNGFYSVSYGGTSGWASGLYLRFGPGATARTTSALNLRSGPSTGNGVRLVIPPGANVKVRGSRNDFLAITYNGVDGWAARPYLAIQPTSSSSGGGGGGGGGSFPRGTYIVTDTLNLRRGPSPGDGVLLVMPLGSRVETTGEARNGFARVRYASVTGWASAVYLDTGGPSSVPREPSNTGFTPRPAGSGIAVVVEDLSFRASPSRTGRVLAVLPAGSEVRLSGSSSNGFYRVFSGSRMGWVAAEYLLPPARPTDRYGYSKALIRSFIVTAAVRYGQNPDAMVRVAECESNLIATAVNRSGSYGIFQFVPSTWASTPYADNDIFEAWANANAAAWMWSVGRRNEWVCQ